MTHISLAFAQKQALALGRPGIRNSPIKSIQRWGGMHTSLAEQQEIKDQYLFSDRNYTKNVTSQQKRKLSPLFTSAQREVKNSCSNRNVPKLRSDVPKLLRN